MNSDFKIHVAKNKDVDACVKILKDTAYWMIEKNMKLWNPEWFTQDYVADEIKKQNAYLVKSNISQDICGFFFIKENDSKVWKEESQDNKGLYLQKMCIDRNYAKREIPALIIKYTENQTIEKNRSFLRLDCASREPLVKLYKENGFKVVEEFEWPREGMTPYYGIKMQKKLI